VDAAGVGEAVHEAETEGVEVVACLEGLAGGVFGWCLGFGCEVKDGDGVASKEACFPKAFPILLLLFLVEEKKVLLRFGGNGGVGGGRRVEAFEDEFAVFFIGWATCEN